MTLDREITKFFICCNMNGGASFDSSLIKEKLIDEFYLFINPVAIGNGMTIFKDLNEIQKYSLIESKVFESGEVLLRYEPKRS